jgi:hypothetical protein
MTVKTEKAAKKQSIRWWDWLLFSIFVTAILTWFSWDLYAYGLAAPPHPECSISEFAETMPPPQHLSVMNVDGQLRLVWIGELPSFTIRSGPPCYVFATDGTLIDWTAETGEGSELDTIVLQAFHAPAVTVEDAIEQFE